MSFSVAMVRKKNKLRITKLFEWLCVLLIIFLSGCPFFTQAHRIETSLVLIVCTFLYCYMRNTYLNKRILNIWAFIVLILLVSFLANATSMTIANYADYVLIFITVTCLSLISSSMSLEVFQEKYIKIMCLICFVSLVCFYVQIFNHYWVYRLGSTNIVDGYIISWYHTWGWTYIFARNAGPFWEPGAFQGFLFLAILFILNSMKIKEHFFALFLLSTGVITSFSTTGYALSCIVSVYFIVLYWASTVKGTIINNNAFIRVVVVVIIAVTLVMYVFDSNVISGKLTLANESFSIRLLDFCSGFEVAAHHPLFGYGINSSSLREAYGLQGMNGNSVGFFSILHYFGFLLGFLYIFLFFYAACKVYRNLNAIVVIVIFVILHLTENLFLFPVYMGFLFFKYSRNKEFYQ